MLWGGSLVCIGLTISLAQGIIHPYYTVALAPPLGALVGIAHHGPVGAARPRWVGRVGLAAGLAATVVWSYVLLGRTSDWFPALRPFVLVVGALGVVAILALPLLRTVPKLAVGLVAALGLGAALAAPLFSTVATAATPHNGAIPSVTPTAAGRAGRSRRRLPRRWPSGRRLPAVASPAASRRRLPRRLSRCRGGAGRRFRRRVSGRRLPRRRRLPGQGRRRAEDVAPAAGFRRARVAGGAGGGFLNASSPTRR